MKCKIIKRRDTAALFAPLLSGRLAFDGSARDDKPLIAVTWATQIAETHTHTHTRGDCLFIGSHDKAVAAEILP